MKVAVLDYGSGNVFSLMNALKNLGISYCLSSDVKELKDAAAIFIPGVGAFGHAAGILKDRGLYEVLRAEHERGKWIIGICLGMQLLFERGVEDGENDGLGFLKGEIRPIETCFKLPHMGWNKLIIRKNEAPISGMAKGKGIGMNSYAYFVHSYCAYPEDENCVLASCDYGIEVPAIVKGEGVLGLQFHPEKSGNTGIELLRSIGEMIK